MALTAGVFVTENRSKFSLGRLLKGNETFEGNKLSTDEVNNNDFCKITLDKELPRCNTKWFAISK